MQRGDINKLITRTLWSQVYLLTLPHLFLLRLPRKKTSRKTSNISHGDCFYACSPKKCMVDLPSSSLTLPPPVRPPLGYPSNLGSGNICGDHSYSLSDPLMGNALPRLCNPNISKDANPSLSTQMVPLWPPPQHKPHDGTYKKTKSRSYNKVLISVQLKTLTSLRS